MERNVERYQLLKFAQRAFRNFRVVPPGTGIVHQVNLEYLAPGGPAPRPVRRADCLSRHPGRHRLPHHHDQRPRRARLGRRRDRGRSGHAGPALLHADPRSHRHEADRRAPGRHHRHRPRAPGHPDAPEEGRGGQVRGVLRPGALRRSASPTGPPSPTWRPSTAPRWASSRWTPRRCGTSSAPGGASDVVERVERYCKEQGLFRTDATPDPAVHLDARARPLDRRAEPRGPEAARRTCVPLATLKRNFIVNLPGLMSARRAGRAEGAGPGRLFALDERRRGQRDHRRERRTGTSAAGRPRRARRSCPAGSARRTSASTTAPSSSRPSPAAPTPRTRR